MILSRHWIVLLGLAIIPATAAAQAKRDAHVIYKDGFVIKGKINESVREVIYDSKSGQPFAIPSGNFFIDDQVRSILFSPTNVQKVIQLKPGDVKPPMQIVRMKSVFQPRDILPGWEFTQFGPWTDKGTREIGLKTPRGPMTMDQKVAIISTHSITAVTLDYKWDLGYFTQEFGPEKTRNILLQLFKEMPDLKKLKDSEKFLQIAAFLYEAGWLKDAEEELNGIIHAYPNDRKVAEEMLEKLKLERMNRLVEGMEQASNVGQHQEAIDRLGAFDRAETQKMVSPRHLRMALDLKAKYDKSKTDLEQVKGHLKQLVKDTKAPRTWTAATEFIAAELNHDTIGRLELFHTFAQQYALDRKAERKPGQSAEEVLAIAVSGWLQGNQAAEADVKNALKLARAREFILEYLRTANDLKRVNLISDFKQKNDLPVDVLARLLRMIPPAQPHAEKLLGTDVQTVAIDLPDSDGGSYLLQLPPDYHPLRSYPVLMLLHSGRDKPEEMLRRFSDEAARHNFILAAPLWAGGAKLLRTTYQHSAKERAVAMDTLRDLRRRLQIDSDHVFLFGWEDGAHMAFDVGLSHPDQFAGVATMNGALQSFTRRHYWPNAQYLPLYIIDGDRSGNSKVMRDLFKNEWTREPYTCLYVEYKGRGSEWYGTEVPRVLDWMSRKKRHTPLKEIGRPNLGGGPGGEEFRSSRTSETRFYWLKSESIVERYLHDHRGKWATGFQPATYQANVSVGNFQDSKGSAKIWNQATIRVTGARQLSFWIPLGLMNLEHPLSIRVNGQQVGGMRAIQPSIETMLEELYQAGDRQRLFIAKIDIK